MKRAKSRSRTTSWEAAAVNQVVGMKAAAMGMERNRWIRVIFRRFISPEWADWLRGKGERRFEGEADCLA